MKRNILKEYFSFTKKERIAMILVVLIIALIWLIPILEAVSTAKAIANDTKWISPVKEPDKKPPDSKPFYFDPNNTPNNDWKKLGIADKTIHTIQNYLDKGGHFKRPEDLKKIYGLRNDDYERLKPYINIKGNRENKIERERKFDQPSPTHYSPNRIIDINTADTTAFISLPGIGSKLAARIVAFREKLGGFYSIDQVGETFGLRDSVFQNLKRYLKLEHIDVRKININTATIDDLKQHPYIRYQLAKVIIAYRDEHGNFSSPSDLRKLVVITEEIYDKIVPYLAIQ